jgi:hypothetical protein
MDIKRRFIFRGNAAAFNGRLIRPVDLVLENSCASSLPVVGGRSVSRVGPQAFGDEVRFKEASTFAEGLFDDARQYEELTHQRGREDLLTTTTRVSAEVRGAVVGAKPQATIARVFAGMRSSSPTGSGETSIRIDRESAVEGFVIDGYTLVVELGTDLFERHDTRAKLLAAADEPAFVAEFGHHLHLRATFDARAVPPAGRVVVGHEYLHCTIVRRLRWDGDPFPGSKIDDNLVVLPNFGRVYFGELLVTASSRRLTMIRMELGSPVGGFITFGDIEDNGGWSP